MNFLLSHYQLFNHWPHLSSPHLHEMWGLYLNQLFRRLAINCTGLYLPIYIWQTTGSLHYIFLFFILMRVLAWIWVFPTALLIRQVGVDVTMLVGSLAHIATLVNFIYLENHSSMLVIAALCYGLTNNLEWIPFHYCVTALSQKSQRFGTSSSFIEIMERIAMALGPLVGGIVITFWGYTWVFLLACGFLVLAGIAPFLDDFQKKGMHLVETEIVARFKDPGIIKYFYGYGVQVVEVYAYLILWPILLITTVGTVLKSGILQSISLMVSIVVLVWLARQLDKNNFSIMVGGSIFSSLSWLLKYLGTTSFWLGLSEVTNSLGRVMLYTPYNSLIYRKAATGYRLEFHLTREMIVHMVAVFVIGLFWLMYWWLASIRVLLPLVALIAASGIFFGKVFAKDIKAA